MTPLTTFKEEAVRESNIKIDWIISTWKDAELTDELVGIKSLILSQITTAHALGRKEGLEEVSKKCEEEKYKRDDDGIFKSPDGMGTPTNISFIEGNNSALSILQHFIQEKLKGV